MTQGSPGALVERRGNVMVITINRPEARNAINSAVSIALGDALEEAQQQLEDAEDHQGHTCELASWLQDLGVHGVERVGEDRHGGHHRHAHAVVIDRLHPEWPG